MATVRVHSTAGAPTNGTNEVQTVTITGTPAGGTWKLAYRGQATSALAHNISGANLQIALRALGLIGADGVSVSGNGPYVVTFQGRLGKLAVPLLTLHTNSLTGGTSPTVTIVETTPGVTATARTAATGAVLVRSDTGAVYVNQSATSLAPNWVQAFSTELADLLSALPVAAVPDLAQTISGTYQQAEVQAISDKVDDILARLRTAGIVTP
jgi:hypothetical protein